MRIVDNVDLDIAGGEALGLVGESGCGKSVLARSALGLLPRRLFQVRGSALLDDRDLVAMTRRQLRGVLGRKVAMIFQEPATAMDPVYPSGDAAYEVLRRHRGQSRAQAWAGVEDLFARVGIDDPGTRCRQIPARLSGGMRQRALIASSIASEVELLVADEPTTALDVTIQAQILALINRLRRDLGTAVLLITHDFGVVASTCDRVAVMYAGRIVELGTVDELFNSPAHPYTRLLLDALRSMDAGARFELTGIAGTVPSPGAWPAGCRFHPRCPDRFEPCGSIEPRDIPLPQRRGRVACHKWDPQYGGRA